MSFVNSVGSINLKGTCFIPVVMGLCLFSGVVVQAAPEDGRAAPAAWAGLGGAVLLQDAAAPDRIGMWALTFDGQGSVWTELPDDFQAWRPLDMDGDRTLFVRSDDGALAIGTLDGSGRIASWLPLQLPRHGVAVAFDSNRVLFQDDAHGPLAMAVFDDGGRVVRQRVLWRDSGGWQVRGMDANRILLEHAQTGDVVVMAMHPMGYLPRPYASFVLSEGWKARDLAGDFILAQHEETDDIRLVRLGDNYQPVQEIELASVGNKGWIAIALSRGSY